MKLAFTLSDVVVANASIGNLKLEVEHSPEEMIEMLRQYPNIIDKLCELVCLAKSIKS